MKTYPITELSLFRTSQKFIWDGRIFTVFTHELGMTEVFDGKRFYAWPSHCKVVPITYDN
jgi:hypothetical protein